jgi:hypothetical protein
MTGCLGASVNDVPHWDQFNAFGRYESPRYNIGQIVRHKSGILVKVMGFRAWAEPIILYSVADATGNYNRIEDQWISVTDLKPL